MGFQDSEMVVGIEIILSKSTATLLKDLLALIPIFQFNFRADTSLLGTARFGITSYGVSRPWIQNSKDFSIKFNIPKGNY